MPEGSLLSRLASLQLIVVTGKGGVGKSVVTATLGRLLSGSGRRVLLIETDPRENLHHLFETPPSGGEIVEVEPLLALQHLDPRSVLDDVVRAKLKIGPLVRKVLASPVHQHFTAGAPGLKETGVFGRILRLLQGAELGHSRRPDLVVLDAPATGHGLTMLRAPHLVAEVIRSGPIGSMAAEIAAFMDDRDRFGVVGVTTAEEMPMQETLELLASLKQTLHRTPELLIVNALYPSYVAEPAAAVDEPDRLVRLWRHRRRVNETQLARLHKHATSAHAELPLLPIDHGPELVEHLRGILAVQLRDL